MARDIRTLESAWLLARVRFEKFQEQFEKEFGQPVAQHSMAVKAKTLQNLPEDIKTISRQQNPAEWAEIDKIAGGK